MHQIEKINEYRVRKVLSLFPFILVNGYGNGWKWTGKWFKFIEITEQKIKERYLEFDDGWSYQEYWTKWEENWIFIKINS